MPGREVGHARPGGGACQAGGWGMPGRGVGACQAGGGGSGAGWRGGPWQVFSTQRPVPAGGRGPLLGCVAHGWGAWPMAGGRGPWLGGVAHCAHVRAQGCKGASMQSREGADVSRMPPCGLVSTGRWLLPCLYLYCSRSCSCGCSCTCNCSCGCSCGYSRTHAGGLLICMPLMPPCGIIGNPTMRWKRGSHALDPFFGRSPPPGS